MSVPQDEEPRSLLGWEITSDDHNLIGTAFFFFQEKILKIILGNLTRSEKTKQLLYHLDKVQCWRAEVQK